MKAQTNTPSCCRAASSSSLVLLDPPGSGPALGPPPLRPLWGSNNQSFTAVSESLASICQNTLLLLFLYGQVCLMVKSTKRKVAEKVFCQQQKMVKEKYEIITRQKHDDDDRSNRTISTVTELDIPSSVLDFISSAPLFLENSTSYNLCWENVRVNSWNYRFNFKLVDLQQLIDESINGQTVNWHWQLFR